MVECLRRDLPYSEKRARDILFNAIERLVYARPDPMILSRLTREGALAAREEAERAGYEFANWDMACKAVLKSMLFAGVLIAPDGREIPAGITAQASTVSGLRHDFRDGTEAYLLEYLIGRMGDITSRDHTALAHALFRQFDPNVPLGDLEDRVVVLLARLADRVDLQPNGVYSTRVRRAGLPPGNNPGATVFQPFRFHANQPRPEPLRAVPAIKPSRRPARVRGPTAALASIEEGNND